MCCHNKGALLLVFWDTTEDALHVDSCLYFYELNCRHFTLFFPAVSIAGKEFSAEIIQLQLPKCLILSRILNLVCLLQPCQEIDVAALGFVQIIKRIHKYFYLAHWSRTLKGKLNWPKLKRFLIHVILLMFLCRCRSCCCTWDWSIVWLNENKCIGKHSKCIYPFILWHLQLRDCQSQSCFLGV